MNTMRTNQPQLAAVVAVALCLGGCGSTAQRRVAAQPKLPRAVAESLAQRSDAVAQALDAGDSCLALRLAQDLQQKTIGAVNAGQVAAPLQEPLQSAVNQLAAGVPPCVAPPADQGNNGKHKGNKKNGEGGD